jgi:hypothetical protein
VCWDQTQGLAHAKHVLSQTQESELAGCHQLADGVTWLGLESLSPTHEASRPAATGLYACEQDPSSPQTL